MSPMEVTGRPLSTLAMVPSRCGGRAYFVSAAWIAAWHWALCVTSHAVSAAAGCAASSQGRAASIARASRKKAFSKRLSSAWPPYA